MAVAHQVADDDLGAGLDGQVKGGELGCVLDPGVDVGLDADQEQDTLDVRALDRHVEEVTPFIVHLERERRFIGSDAGWTALEVSSNQNRAVYTGECVCVCVCVYLFGGAWLSLQDGLCSLVVLVRHGAGEGGHALAVTHGQTDVRVGDEQLDDDAVLVADGNVDGGPSLRVLGERRRSQIQVRSVIGPDPLPSTRQRLLMDGRLRQCFPTLVLGEHLSSIFFMFPCSNTPDSNEWVVI